jgi:hypothetical protein
MNAEARRVFISHVHEEAALGAVVKAVIEDVFRNPAITAFLSSDMQDLPAGRKWLDVITAELDQARVVVSLISPTSLRRPWVNIELGAGWIKGRHVIPLCHSGQRVADLPRPFGDFNGVGLDQDDAAERLLGGVADGFGLTHPRRLAFKEMLAELRAAAAGIEVIEADDTPVAKAAGPALLDDQVTVLKFLALCMNRGQEYIPEPSLAQGTGLSAAVLRHHLQLLSKQNFLGGRHRINAPTAYAIRPEGTGWLIAHHQMPE